MTTLRVATLNLRKGEFRWGERAPLIFEHMARLRPDIIAFQEVDLRLDQGNYICRRANDLLWPGDVSPGYRIHHMANPRENVSLEALAVMTRLPVVEHQGFDYLIRNRVAHRVRVDAGGSRLDFYNTHFHHELDAPGNEMRAEQAAKLTAWIASQSPDTPVVLVGDFNCMPGTRPLRTIGERLTSVFDTLGRAAPATAPSPMEPRRYPGAWPVDHIFASRDVQVTDAGLAFDQPDARDGSVWCSDHFGLSATIKIA